MSELTKEQVIEFARQGSVEIERGYSGPDSKWTYHWVIDHPDYPKLIIGVGEHKLSGLQDDLTWSFEEDRKNKSKYL